MADEELAKAKAERKLLKNALKAEMAKSADLKSTSKKQAKELDRLQTQLSKTMDDLDQRTQEVDRLRAELNNVKSPNQTSTAPSSANEEQFQKEREQMRRDLQQKDQQLSSLTQQLQATERDLQMAKQAAEQKTNSPPPTTTDNDNDSAVELEELEAALNQKGLEIIQLREQLAAADKRAVQNESEAVELQRKLATQQQQADSESSALRSRVAHLEQQRERDATNTTTAAPQQQQSTLNNQGVGGSQQFHTHMAKVMANVVPSDDPVFGFSKTQRRNEYNDRQISQLNRRSQLLGELQRKLCSGAIDQPTYLARLATICS